jgi:hypothetical protein
LVSVSRWPLLDWDCCVVPLALELPVERLELDLLAARLAPERDRLAVDLLFPFLDDPLLDVEPDLLLALLDGEREVASVRFACVRPRLLPRRD